MDTALCCIKVDCGCMVVCYSEVFLPLLYLNQGARHGWALNQLCHFDLKSHEWISIKPTILYNETTIITGVEVPVSSDHGAIVRNNKMLVFGKKFDHTISPNSHSIH